jgi:hypothetical protein
LLPWPKSLSQLTELKELAWLSLFDEREASAAVQCTGARKRVQLAPASKRNSIWSVIVPADGTRTATVGNGDFGTSPIFGQFSDKPLLAYIWSCGVSDVKNNGTAPGSAGNRLLIPQKLPKIQFQTIGASRLSELMD